MSENGTKARLEALHEDICRILDDNKDFKKNVIDMINKIDEKHERNIKENAKRINKMKPYVTIYSVVTPILMFAIGFLANKAFN